MKQFIRYNFIAAFVFSIMAVISSCTKEETFNPQISALTSTNKEVTTASQGYPNDLIIAEGVQLNEMRSIGFIAGADTVDVVFNPVLNSAVAVMFNIPFDETKGSKLGNQQIVFINKDGKSIMQPFEILQPEPEISTFEPLRPKAGESTIIVGKWFQNLVSVSFAGQPAEYEQLSSTEIYIEIPEGSVSGEVVVTTSIGSVTKVLDVDLGYNIYLYDDFDGGGMFATNDWWTNGDLADVPVSFSDVNGLDGNYIEVTWSGSTTNGWGNCEPAAVSNVGILETNPADVLFVFDIFVVSSEGAAVEIQIDDGTGANWALTANQFSAAQVGAWSTIELGTADFKRNYGGGEATGDMDLQGILKIKIAIPNWTGVAPTKIRIDNMRFHGYY